MGNIPYDALADITTTTASIAFFADINDAIAARHDLSQNRVVEELYDVQKDPDCLINLIDGPAQQEELGALRKALETWMVETGDHMLEVYRKRDDPVVRDGSRQGSGKLSALRRQGAARGSV